MSMANGSLMQSMMEESIHAELKMANLEQSGSKLQTSLHLRLMTLQEQNLSIKIFIQ